MITPVTSSSGQIPDILTGWNGMAGGAAKQEQKVRGAIHEVQKSLPFACKRLDSDNGSESSTGN